MSFWKRDKKLRMTPIGLMRDFPVPPKKEYENMVELLRTAEYFSSINKELEKKVLQTLIGYINFYTGIVNKK